MNIFNKMDDLLFFKSIDQGLDLCEELFNINSTNIIFNNKINFSFEIYNFKLDLVDSLKLKNQIETCRFKFNNDDFNQVIILI